MFFNKSKSLLITQCFLQLDLLCVILCHSQYFAVFLMDSRNNGMKIRRCIGKDAGRLLLQIRNPRFISADFNIYRIKQSMFHLFPDYERTFFRRDRKYLITFLHGLIYVPLFV